MDAVKKAGDNAALDYVNVLKGLFTSPVETVSAFVAKANVIMIAILIGGQAIYFFPSSSHKSDTCGK